MINVITQFKTTLVAGISAASTGGTFESNASGDADSATIPDGDYGIVIDERNGNREYATITLTGYDFVFIKRGLSLIDGDTEKTANKKPHRKGAEIKMVTAPILPLLTKVFNGLLPLTGILYNDAARSYTSDYQLVDKKYVDDIAIAGSPKASNTVYGIAKLSVAAVSAVAPIVVGDNDPRLPTADEKAALAGDSTPSATNKFVTAAALVGVILPYAGATAPAGYLLANGATVSQTTYAALYAVIGHTYGADPGGGNFILPDLRGRVAVGKSADTEFDALGETGGEKSHTLSAAESGLPAHVHNVKGYSPNAGTGGLVGTSTTASKVTDQDSDANSAAAASSAHNNLQPYITLNYIIKY